MQQYRAATMRAFTDYPYEMGSAVAALQNSFRKRYKTAVKWLAAAVANFSCLTLPRAAM